jgi:hypothetical protein
LRVFDTREPRFWESLTADTTRWLTYFHAVILKHLAEDQVVLVSHAMPAWVPKSVSHVFRVRTIAPIEVRVGRVMGEEHLSARHAEHRVHESDREVHARMRSVLKVDIEDAQHYDVMLNTASAPLDTLAAVVIDLARAVEKNSRELAHRAKRCLHRGAGPCRAYGSTEDWARRRQSYVQYGSGDDHGPLFGSALGPIGARCCGSGRGSNFSKIGSRRALDSAAHGLSSWFG